MKSVFCDNMEADNKEGKGDGSMEKAEVIKAFHLMWDNYPESAMLID